jgi:asparagine synthase (glutamine-hydrolysing)
MASRLAHRGPDGAGTYSDGCAALGHTRLSVVDLVGGRQPMANEDGSLRIVYNGEIYNHRDLRRDLVSRGHRYRTESDTETILHLYEEEGEACVERLRGMFAFAVWDARRRRLFLARDRMGIKPVYYHQDAQRFRFASEIKALLADPEVEPCLDRAALPEHLVFGYSHGDATLFHGIRSLPPGHTLTVAAGRVVMRRYWNVLDGIGDGTAGERGWTQRGRLSGLCSLRVRPRSSAVSHPSPSGAVARFRALFEDAVRAHLMSDVPVGLFLSGGIDSSAIAAVMSRLVERPVPTFSIGFPEEGFHEFEYAREVSRAFGTEHHEAILDAEGFRDSLTQAIWHHDTPICFPAAVPLYHLARLASRRVKVVLTGEGSDELLAGYRRTAATCWNARLGGVWQWCPPGVRLHLASALIRALPSGSRWARIARRSFLAGSGDWRRLHWEGFYTIFSREAQAELLGPIAREGDPYRTANAWLDQVSDRPLLERLLYADMKGYLVELLMKQDKMSMAGSIESRVPFLDAHLVAFCASLKPSLKLKGLKGKVLLRRAMHGELPERILRRPKQGFPVPLAAWLRGPWRDFLGDVLLDRTARERGLFDPVVVERFVVEHTTGAADHANRLWMLLNLELWQREFLDGGRTTNDQRRTTNDRTRAVEEPGHEGLPLRSLVVGRSSLVDRTGAKRP